MNAMNHDWAEASLRPNNTCPALLRGLNADEMSRVWNRFEEDCLADGEVLLRDRAEPLHIGLVLKGALREDVSVPQGGTRLFALTFAGEALSPLGPRQKGGRLSAIGDTRLLTCDHEGFADLSGEIPRLQLNLFGVLQDQIEDAHRWQLLLGRKTAAERVASILAWFHMRQGTPEEMDLPVTRAELGEMSSLTLETVSRQVRALEKVGVISLPKPSQVRVLDSKALLERSCNSPILRAA